MSQTSEQRKGSPPPYGEARRNVSDGEVPPPSEAPPAYEPPADAPADVKVRQPTAELTQTASRNDQQGSGNQPGPSSSSSLSASSSSLNPLSLVQSYKDKRRAKEAAKKVDFYEKMYGFVPKNAMTEAEWKDARARAPKVKKPVAPGARSYFGPH